MIPISYAYLHVHTYTCTLVLEEKNMLCNRQFLFQLMVPKPKAQMPQGFIAEGKMCLMCLQQNLLITGLQLREQHT